MGEWQGGNRRRRTCHMRGTVLHKRTNSSCFAADKGFQAANRNASEAVFIRTIPAGKGLEKNCVLATCRSCILWVPVPDHWRGLLGCSSEPQGHTQPAWCAENRRGSVLSCLAPRCVGGGKHVYALCGEKIQVATNPPSPSIGSALFASV